MLFGNKSNNYFNEHDDSFTDKLSSLARFAGIVTTAVAVSPLIGRGGGALRTLIAEGLSEENSLVSRFFGKATNIADTRSMFSEGFNFVTEELPQIKRAVNNAETHINRGRALISALRAEVHEEHLDEFDSRSGEIASVFHDLLAGVEKKTLDVLTSDKIHRDFLDTTKGIEFKFIQASNQERTHLNVKERKSLINILSGALEEAETSPANSGDRINSAGGFESITNAILEHLREANIKEAKKLTRFNNPNLLPIQIRDLEKDPELAEQVRMHLKRIGSNDVDYLTKAKTNLDQFFGGISLGEDRTHLASEFRNEVDNTFTGYAKNLTTGEVVSLAHTDNTLKKSASNVVQNLQLPLVPGKFQVPLTIGRRLGQASQVVKDLGDLSKQGELVRAGEVQKIPNEFFGISIGKNVVAFDINNINPARKLNGTFSFIDTSISEHTQHYVAARNLDIDDQVSAFERSLKESGLVKTIKDYVTENDPHTHSSFSSFLHSKQNDLFDLDFNNEAGFSLIPKAKIGDVATLAAMKMFGGLDNIGVEDIHPKLLMRFLDQEGIKENLPSSVLNDVYRQVITQAAGGAVDSSPYLKSVASHFEDLSFHENIEIPFSYGDKIKELMANSDNPTELLRILNEDQGEGSMLTHYATIQRYVSPEMSLALATIKENKQSLFEIGVVEGTFSEKNKQNLFGVANFSGAHRLLQEGLVAESVRGSGMRQLEIITGNFQKSVSNELLDPDFIATTIREIKDGSGKFSTYSDRLVAAHGLTDENHLRILTDSLINPNNTINYKKIGSLVSPLANITNLLGDENFVDARVSAKIAEVSRADALLSEYYSRSQGSSNRIIDQLIESTKISQAISLRFKPGSVKFAPNLSIKDEVPRFYAHLSGENVSIAGTLTGIFDPSQASSHTNYVLNALMHMPQAVGNTIGLGLPEQDGVTVARSIVGFALKRVVPLYVGIEAYKNFNSDAHDAGLNGFDDAGANLFANIGLKTAKFKDTLGITNQAKKIVAAIPGLDMYLNPMHEDEYREHLLYGDEDVRKGRFFVIGSRTPFTGGEIEYTRPNYYRRWKSHWTEADNVQLSNSKYSFLPNLAHPLATLNRILHPHFRQELTAKDRPYPTHHQLEEFLHDQESGLKVEGINGENEDGAVGYASFGNGLPIVTKDFKKVLPISEGNGSGEGGEGSGYGSGSGSGHGKRLGHAYRKPGSSTIRITNKKNIPSDAFEEHSALNHGIDLIEESTRHMGLIGGIARLFPIFPEKQGAFQIQDPDKVFDDKRMLFLGQFGELSGPIGEFYRRFVNQDRQDVDAFNPLCMHPDTKVRTRQGLTKIKDLTIGQEIFSNGVFKRVKNIWLKEHNDKIIEVKISSSNIQKLTLSLDHKVWMKRGRSTRDEHFSTKDTTPGDWYPAIAVGYDSFIGYPIPKITEEVDEIDLANYVYEKDVILTDTTISTRYGRNNKKVPRFIPLDEEFGFIAGMYLAEGSLNPNGQIKFASHLKEQSYRDRIRAWCENLGLVCFEEFLEGTNKACIVCTSTILAQALNQIFGKVKEKRLPLNWQKMPLIFLQNLLKGWIFGDGHFQKDKNGVRISSVVQQLSLDMRDLLLVFDIVAPICLVKREKENKSDTYILSINSDMIQKLIDLIGSKDDTNMYLETRRTGRNYFIQDGYVYFKVQDIKIKQYKGDLIDIEVEGLHSFCTDLALLHNSNRAPEFLPSRFHTGDFYARVEGIGELQLPGDAYERANSFVRPMKARGSMIGLSEDEIVERMLDPIGSEDSENAEIILNYGSEAHKKIMRQMREKGILIGAEVAGYDKEHNISATIETIIRGETGKEIVEIKTRGNDTFNTDPEKYIDQLQFYMYLVGAKRGHLAHINRNDPSQVRIVDYDYDPERVKAIFEKVDRARARIKAMADQGLVSPYDTYDLLSRIEILSKVAPDSAEFRQYVKQAENGGGFGGIEKERYERSLERARKLNEKYNLYAYRNVPTQTENVKVEGINSKGEIVTSIGTVKLAGVKFDRQAFSLEDPETVLAKFGINVGGHVKLTLVEGQFGSEALADTTFSAIIGNANRKIINSRYGQEDFADRSPLAAKVRGSTSSINYLIEKTLHNDSMFFNKFLRVRSGLEQFKRGEVYGTDAFSFKQPYSNYIEPTFNSIVSKNPIAAAAQAAVVTSIFFRTSEMKNKVASIAAVGAGVLSVLRKVKETIQNDGPLTPSRYKKQTELDEYYDILEYIKESTVAEEARQKALKFEGIDIRTLSQSEKRMKMQIGTYTALALQAESRAKKTMYGFDAAKDQLQDALYVIPKRHRQIAENIILNGTKSEKKEFYSLLPNEEKRTLGKFLGVDLEDLPNKPRLAEYFKQHYLPDTDWAGWESDVSLNDIKTRAADLEGIKIEKPGRSTLNKAKAYTKAIRVPIMHSPTASNIRKRLDRLIATGKLSNVQIDYRYVPSSKNSIEVNANIEDTDSTTYSNAIQNAIKY